MACKACRARGYIEAPMLKADGCYGNLAQCTECRDIEKYSRQVRFRYARVRPEPAKVIHISAAIRIRNGS